MKRFLLLLIFIFTFSSGLLNADITNPASLKIVEKSPSKFEAVFSLPLINGKVLKAFPKFPDNFKIIGEPTIKKVSGSVIRTWQFECSREELTGSSIGISGILGTSFDFLLTIETLDGRKYVETLRPTKSFYYVPEPPGFLSFINEAGGSGIRLILTNFFLIILLFAIIFSGVNFRKFLWIIIPFVISQIIAQYFADEKLVVMSAYLPNAVSLLASFIITLEIINVKSKTTTGFPNPLWILFLFLGFIFGASQTEVVKISGVSNFENYFVYAFVALGSLSAFILLYFCIVQLKNIIYTFDKEIANKLIYWIGFLLAVLSTGLFLYQFTTPIFVQGTFPKIPLIIFLSSTLIGIWLKIKFESVSKLYLMILPVFYLAGIILNYNGIALPYSSFIVLGFVAFIAVDFLIQVNPSKKLRIVLSTLFAIYLGNYITFSFRSDTSLPEANIVGLSVLLILFIYMGFKLTLKSTNTKTLRRTNILLGLFTLTLAILWRGAEYIDWISEVVIPTFSMGLILIPVLTIILVAIVLLIWPRKRKFKVDKKRPPIVHQFVLILIAFFVLPLTSFTVQNPFYAPEAPPPNAAAYIIDEILTKTYFAFNVSDEEKAFDILEANLAENLVDDIYLDSRRRLTTGTREGASVRVKDVKVINVEEAIVKSQSQNTFTYPCKWIVTARVKHLQHIHDRRNIYLGELTIKLIDKDWKITKLVLKKEDREVIPWMGS